MQRLNISHVTEYRFAARVSLQPHRLLLHPRESHQVRIESSVLDISPAHSVQWKRDVLDNSVAVVRFNEMTDRLLITSNVVIQHYDDNPFDFLIDFMFSFNIMDNLLSLSRYHNCMLDCPLLQATQINIEHFNYNLQNF